VGRSRGGLTTKIHALVDAKGRPLRLLITPGQTHDTQGAAVLLNDLRRKSVVIADKGYDADWIRAYIRAQGAKANIPNTASRKRRRYRWQKQLYRWQKQLYRERNLIERFFNKLKQFRRVATRYDKLGAAFFAFIQLAAVRIWLRSIESTA
jgi:transposase